MDESILREIANEIKGLNNHAVKLIKEGRLADAETYYQKSLELTRVLTYYDGMAKSYFNLANLEVLKDDLFKAITYGALCREMHEKAKTDTENCDKLLGKLSKAAMKKGMELEKKGMLKEAVEYYQAGIPFAEEKFRQAMQKEIELIERVTNAKNNE
ncbi:MAG: tetratricopeptide repeat protein [Methanimicrococcus sp.]|nr:tetratricopeptide repeat protein [Methanimicrococcus sp.]